MCSERMVLIETFFQRISSLEEANIIRSNNFLGDIGEWLCVQKYGLVLEESGRHPGYDGKIEDMRVQVKLHNSPIRTNLNASEFMGFYERKLWIQISPSSRTPLR